MLCLHFVVTDLENGSRTVLPFAQEARPTPVFRDRFDAADEMAIALATLPVCTIAESGI